MKNGLYSLLSLLLTLNVVDLSVAKNASLVVDLGYAEYQGVLNDNTSNVDFLGIRYAKPPTGALRWKAPQYPDPVPGIQLANSQPPLCPQAFGGISQSNPFRNLSGAVSRRDIPGLPPNQDEDCLYLNVHVPGSQFNGADATYNDAQGLPVVVYIHGGGFVFGGISNASFPGSVGGYDGEDLLRNANNGVIAVIIQYRLGLFGWMAGESIKADGDLNQGLLDQQFALRWVQQHISKFGGDPSRVTIWGESGGGGSVLTHIVANDGCTEPPLFKGAISSSGVLVPYLPYNHPIPETLYTQVVEQANCSGSQNTLACLRAADVTVLAAANLQVNDEGYIGTYPFGPVIDGTFLTQRPTQLLSAGKINKVEKFLGVHNSDEGTIFLLGNNVTSLVDFTENLFSAMSENNIAEVSSLYSGLAPTVAAQSALVYGESTFVCPTYYYLETLHGIAYKGMFAVAPAFHTADVFYYFNTSLQSAEIPKFNNQSFQQAFAQGFLTFASSKDFNPNGKFDQTITPEWPLWDSQNSEMVFNRSADGLPAVGVVSSDEGLLSRCRFWHSVTNETFQ